MTEPTWILEETALAIHEAQIDRFGGSVGIRDINLLKSALARPQQIYHYGKPTFAELAAAYTGGIIQNHPFVDGNKRVGFLIGVVFLEVNGLPFSAPQADAASIIIAMAAGEFEEKGLAGFYDDWTKG